MKKMFSPIAIGTMQLKNRLVMAPMTTNYADAATQAPSDRLIAFLEERARGGVGLITVEVCTVDPAQKYQPQSMTLGCDDVIDAHRRLTDALHRHGVKVQPQITHPGPESLIAVFSNGAAQAVGPADCTGACTGLPARQLSAMELDAIVEQYGEAARRARLAGYDGIELHAAHSYMLLGTFLSPLKNKRLDEYGAGTAENRARLLIRVLRRIKAVAGADFPITLRISGFERIPGGRDATDTAAMAPWLVEAGVDAFHVSGGVSDPMVSQMICGPEAGDGYNLPAAEAIKRVVDVPVMAVGRFLDPEFAEATLRAGKVDMIVAGRPFLADPHWPNKFAQGQTDQIRRCISCQNCIDSMFLAPFDARMNCAVNAAAGRELALGYAKAAAPKHVVVIGAGPGGMEAARVAAERGHRVTLLERSRRLGGSLTLAAAVHRDNGRLLDYLKRRMAHPAIDLRLNTPATVALVQSLRPDEVVVATGARVALPDLPGLNGARVLTGNDLRGLASGEVDGGAGLPAWLRWSVRLAGPIIDRHLSPQRLRDAADLWLPLGRRVAIVGGDLAAIELAEFIARRGRAVVLLHDGPTLAPEIGPKRRLEHELRLDALGVSMNAGIAVRAIEAGGVRIAAGAGAPRLVAADSVIVTGTPVADTRLFDELTRAGLRCHAVGDCTGLGLIVKAIREGAEAAHAC